VFEFIFSFQAFSGGVVALVTIHRSWVRVHCAVARQATYNTCVPLSPSSITWYCRSNGSDALRLGRWP